MEKIKKTIAVLLVGLMLACAVSAPSTADSGGGRPSGFNMDVMGRTTVFVSVQIEDMLFIGTIRPQFEDKSNAEIDRLIRETMAEVGLTEDRFNKAAKELYEGLTQEKLNNIRDALVTIIGTLPVVGEAANAVKYLDQMAQGDYDGARKTAFDFIIGELNPVYKGYRLVDEMGNVIEQFRSMFSTDVAKLNEFYSRLRPKIKNLPVGKKVLEIKNEKQKRPFIFGIAGIMTPMDEIWTLNMMLYQAKSPNQFEGDFSISIVYDVRKFPEAWRSDVQKSLNAISGNGVWYDVAPAGYGSLELKRKMTGNAYAEISLGRVIINTWTSDKKTVNVDDTFLYYDAYMGPDHRDGYKYTVEYNDHGIIWSYEGYQDPPFSITQPYEWHTTSCIYDRSDRVKKMDFWIMRTVYHDHLPPDFSN